MKKLFFFISIAAFIACNPNAPSATDKKFDEFKKEFTEAMWQQNPTGALYSGYHKYDSIMFIPTKANIDAQNIVYQKLLQSLKTYDIENLTINNKTDWKMIENYLQAAQWYNTDFRSYEWDPSGYNVGGDFAQIINENYDKLDNRLRMASKRLEKVQQYYATAKENLKSPTLEHTDLAIQQNRGSISVFQQAFVDSVKKSTLNATEKAELLSKADIALGAINDYVNWLEKTVKPSLKPETTRSFRIGKDLYNKKFDFDITSGYSAEQVFKKAIERKYQIHEEMFKITDKLWSKYFPKKQIPSDKVLAIKMMIDTISINHVNRDSLIPAIKKQLPELVEFIKQKNILYIDPSKPLIVRETPTYMQGVAGASVSSPGPYEKNGNTYYNVTPLTAYSPQQAESYLREYNHYVLQILNIHEAIPGHYTQLVYSNQSPSLIKSILGNGAMVEGWAVYSERMMLEEGYGNNEPEMWLMYYKWHIRTVCNTILDYSVHVLGMSKEDAMNLLTKDAFQQQAEAEGKWRRVTLTQVQLCSYFTGFTEIYALREEQKKKLGDKFSLKAFNEKFLSFGSAPVKFIKELMN
jgi:uncharacterized protein (DUF885 family)